ncbi:hypothetical protein [Thermoflavimicrobium daqui]|nr:hypothetical protein [Thermoflavimicrobium daqui]
MIIVTFLIAMIPKDTSAATLVQNRFMYVWNADQFLGNDENQTLERNQLAKFIKDKGIQEIFFASSLELKNIESNQDPSRLQQFIAEMNKIGVKVHALGGDVKWVENDGQDAVQFLNRVKKYNQTAPINSRFAGIQFDVEPWQKQQMSIYLDAYKKMIDRVYIANDHSLKLGYAIAAWFDSPDHAQQNYYKVNQYVQQRSDYVSVMAYRDQADQIISWARGEVNYAAQIGKKVIVSIETHPIASGVTKDNTFGDGNLANMEGHLSQVYNEFKSYPNFLGIGIHAYEYYRKMK